MASTYSCQVPTIDNYIGNLTSSYTDKGNEPTMVSASVIMFVLAGLFFNLNLFSSLSDVSAILDPKVRLILSSALSLFLPVMSYLFSEAKNAGVDYTSSAAARVRYPSDLSLRAGMILVWMLLVELLRKKVDEIHMHGYSGTIQRAGRVVWLGSLVCFNIRSTGRKAVFGILWVLCATKLVQRIAYTEVGKRSYAHGKNARLLTSYMSQMLRKDQQELHVGQDVEHAVNLEGRDEANELLKGCEYIVMGEEGLVEEATADGYKLKRVDRDDLVVTVGKIWELPENDRLFTTVDRERRLKRLCLSFALFKLLRRRFEHLPAMTKDETHNCRDLIFKGLYNKGVYKVDELFQIINDEVNFLSEYYHSVIPVVLASPFFFLANYFLLPIVVFGLCIMTIILCGDGNVHFAFSSISTDNYTISSGITKIIGCLLIKIKSPPAFFSIVDLFITFLLFIIFFYEEVWEFVVFLLSNWFMVSLLCNYAAKPLWRKSPTFSGAVRRILWLRSKMSQPRLSFKQFSVLDLRWPLSLGLPAMLSLMLRTSPVPNEAKRSIMEHLVSLAYEHDRDPLTAGRSISVRNGLFDQLSWAHESDSVAEVILTWHIATSLLEVKYPDGAGSIVATRLSKYCAYLVAFHPELLPDNNDKTESVFEAMKAELKGILGCWDYYLSLRRTRVKKIIDAAGRPCWEDRQVVRNGATLGDLLMKQVSANNDDSAGVWKLLADVWTELIVYVAPSSDEERVMGHEQGLVQGGEFVTVIWALATHTGITRTAKPSTSAGRSDS